MKKNSGITLIALVITIVIMLIIATISVTMLAGDNSLIHNAGEAKEGVEEKNEKDIINLAVTTVMNNNEFGELVASELVDELNANYSDRLTATISGNTVNVIFNSGRNYDIDTDGNVVPGMPTVANAPKEPVGEKTKYTDPNGDTAIIPENFKVINYEDQPEIDDGLVVKDGANNEWVWIPVPDASVMYTHVDEGIAITGGSGNTYLSGVTTNYYSKSGIISGKTRGLPNTTSSYREPDVVVDSGGTSYDAVEGNYSAAGFTSLQNMAQSLVDDYEEMISSVEKNKGFYVGRYELTGSVSSPTEVAGIPLASQNWYNLYKACKGFTVEGVVESRMIWGCQWDAIMLWMLDSDDTSVQTYVTDSTNKGNYSGSRINTGSNSSYEVNGIFDLAGNCWEWTQEAYGTNNRASRGRQLR